ASPSPSATPTSSYLPAESFAPLGRPGCHPVSPVRQSPVGTEALATGTGGQVWALLSSARCRSRSADRSRSSGASPIRPPSSFGASVRQGWPRISLSSLPTELRTGRDPEPSGEAVLSFPCLGAGTYARLETTDRRICWS